MVLYVLVRKHSLIHKVILLKHLSTHMFWLPSVWVWFCTELKLLHTSVCHQWLVTDTYHCSNAAVYVMWAIYIIEHCRGKTQTSTIMRITMFCSGVLLLCVATTAVAQPSPVLHFSLMVSDDLSLNTTSVLPAVEQEVQSINSDISILPGYSLQYNIHRLHEVRSAVFRDIILCTSCYISIHTQCNSTDALRQFLHAVKSGDHVMLGMIGCGCSAATDEVAKISSFWNIPLVRNMKMPTSNFSLSSAKYTWISSDLLC